MIIMIITNPIDTTATTVIGITIALLSSEFPLEFPTGSSLFVAPECVKSSIYVNM